MTFAEVYLSGKKKEETNLFLGNSKEKEFFFKVFFLGKKVYCWGKLKYKN